MQRTAFLFGAILLFTANAGAQANLEPPAQPASSALEVSQTPGITSSPASPQTFALAISPVARALAAPSPAPNSSASSDPAAQQPSVYGVFQVFNWQLYGGYAFVRFYEVPKTTLNLNGFELGMVYYPGGKWIGLEGKLLGGFGSQPGGCGCTAKFVVATGGPRFRWAAPRGMELWAHGLVGGTHFLPQTPYGSQSAFAYEAGGGIDIGAHNRRIAYRVGAGMVGTRYFSTYQYSPVVTVGIVYKY
jgi:hypothetical protein